VSKTIIQYFLINHDTNQLPQYKEDIPIRNCSWFWGMQIWEKALFICV